MRTHWRDTPSRQRRAAGERARKLTRLTEQEAQAATVQRLYESGLSVVQVALEIGRHEITVRRILHARSVALRKPVSYPRVDLRKRLLSRAIVNPQTHCWEWVGCLDQWGYGLLKDHGVMRRAHRVSFAMWYGPIPDGLEIDHLCYVRRCINPDHLEAVTGPENIRRAAARRKRNGKEKPGDYPVMLHGKDGGGVQVYLTPAGTYSLRAPEAAA